MSKKFEISVEAERFIHNDLSNCAFTFSGRTEAKFESGETAGVYHDMMASLVFCAFAIEAKVNFVGWKTFEEGWPERAPFDEKVRLLNKYLNCDLDKGKRPLQTVSKLMKLRNTLAHGRPEIVKKVEVTEVEPVVWDALKGQWEETITRDFVNKCQEDEKILWDTLLSAAKIELHETLTHGGHTLRSLIETE